MKTNNKNINQMLLVGINEKKSIEKVISLIEKYAIGGVLIYKNNYSNYQEMVDLVIRLKKANVNNPYPLFIAIDQENGRVNRMPKEFEVIKNATALGKSDEQTIKEAANITSEMLNRTGINMNFAPVVDLKKWHDNHAIGNRAFSSDPNIVSKIGNIIVKEHQNNNVVPVIKHFPGHGSIKMDSHIFLPIIKHYDEILKNDIIPFKELLKKGADAVMVGHILIKNYTGFLPASLSKQFIQNELRESCNYDGIIMTDELLMKSISIIYGKRRAIKKAIMAGNDILCCKYHHGIEKTIVKINKLYMKNKINQEVINKSLSRIFKIKKKYEINDKTEFDILDINNINQRINLINEKII